ncbi:MAG: DUF3418 domain-containing protein, partial [Victivallaceae bacterium]
PGEELDGACIVAAQDEIALLPGWALEYPPLGLLAEKVELLLKSLPKSERIKCNPITPCAEEFVEAIREKKHEVFKLLRPLTEDDWCLGQYAAYREAPGVAADSTTPTFAAMRVFVDNWRWYGVPFYLRSGKGLREKKTEITIL